MKIRKVRTPLLLLIDATLTNSAKLIWMVLRLDATTIVKDLLSPTRLANRTGLTRPTVRQALKQLKETGWYKEADGVFRGITYPVRCDVHVYVPGDLLVSHNVEVQARVLYGVLQAKRYFPKNKFTYAYLSELTHKDVKTVRRAVEQLLTTEWLQFTYKHKWAPKRFWLPNPRAAYRDKVEEHLKRADFYGEAILQEWVGLMVPSNDLIYNARPKFLTNPRTGERMELDCYFFRLGVALEFNGAQHDGETELYSAEEAAKQKERDELKMMICKKLGIELIIIKPEDLSLKTLLQKIGNRLPIQDLQSYGLAIDYLEKVSEAYRVHAQNWLKQETEPRQERQ